MTKDHFGDKLHYTEGFRGFHGKTGKTDYRIPFKAHELFDGEQRFTREEWEEFIRTLAAWVRAK